MTDRKGFLNFSRVEPVERHPLLRIKDFNEIGPPAKDHVCVSQARRCMDCGVPFCINGCPLGNPIPGFNHLSQEENWYEAQKLLHETNNFPEFTGKVCPAPCESACVLGVISRPVTIKLLEEKIIEKSFEQGWVLPVLPKIRTGKRVSVVGSGPAGLACAQQLNRMGHWVRVIEKRAEPGGLLTWGIPEYKLPKKVVRRRVSQLREEEIEFVTNCELGKDISLEQLQSEADAVVLCLGAERPRDLMIPGRQLKGIHFAMDFLAQKHREAGPVWPGQDIIVKDKKVVVIGGGDTGADCIGTSLRLGAAQVVNLEILSQAPAQRSITNPWPEYAKVFKPSTSFVENLAFGGKGEYQTQTVRFVGDKGNALIGLETVNLGGMESKGPTQGYRNEDVKFWPCDIVFLALGYLGGNYPLILHGQTEESQMPYLDHLYQVRADKRLFLCGDYRIGQSLVVSAISDGRKVAQYVNQWLKKQPCKFGDHTVRSPYDESEATH